MSKTPSGGPTSWTWEEVEQEVDTIPDGGPTSWAWQLLDGLATTPIGTPIGWEWGWMGPIGWTELFHTLSVPSLVFTWEDRDLHTLYGVPKGAVVLLALYNEEQDSDNTVWAREKNGLNVGHQIQEAEGGGAQVFTTFCQTDANGVIEVYQGDLTYTRIFLMGYLTGCTYTAIGITSHNPFADDTWEVEGDAAYANRVVCIRFYNVAYEDELLCGIREVGSSLSRYFAVMEREGAGAALVGDILVQADESGNFEAYRQAGSGNQIAAMGYFSLNVSFTEAMLDEDVGDQVPWGDEVVTAPVNSLAQFIITNNYPVDERWGGIREKGSTLNRMFDMREAEGMGLVGFSDLVNVDGSQLIENYIEQGAVVDLWYVGHLTIG